jgi:hypothetical protein
MEMFLKEHFVAQAGNQSVNGHGKGTASAVPLGLNNDAGFSP